MLRDSFFGRGLSRGSVDRMFSTIRATINFTAREMGLPEVSSFSGIYLGEEGRSPETKRLPIPLQTIRSIQRTSETAFMFPRYCSEYECKSNSASAALNKWLRPKVPEDCVIHSFRHSIRDRLRAVECPQDITDRLGGWTVGGVGETYGSGYPTEVLHKWMKKAVEG